MRMNESLNRLRKQQVFQKRAVQHRSIWLHDDDALRKDDLVVGVKLSDVREGSFRSEKKVATAGDAARHPAGIGLGGHKLPWGLLEIAHLYILCGDEPQSALGFLGRLPTIVDEPNAFADCRLSPP